MPQGPFLIFDKSSLESLNLDEAVMLDNFYMSNITPLFFVECLADLEKAIRSNSTPEQPGRTYPTKGKSKTESNEKTRTWSVTRSHQIFQTFQP
jgi:hypothetical protein